jgi:hypothetical protein
MSRDGLDSLLCGPVLSGCALGLSYTDPPSAAIDRLRNAETQADIARTYGVDATTIGRLDCSAA